MDFRAIQKYLLMSPRKIREVVPMVKSFAPQDAVDRLPFAGKKAGEDLRKVIMTAIANAKQKGVQVSDLIFKEIQVNEAPRLKRFRAGARGRAKPYKRRMSHIRVVLTTKVQSSDVKAQREENTKAQIKDRQTKEGGKAEGEL